MIVIMRRVTVNRRPFQPVLPAKLFVTARSIAVAITRTTFWRATHALNVMMMTFLRQSDFSLKTENLLLPHKDDLFDVRISDFGFAKRVLYPNSLCTQIGTEVC